MTHGVRRSYSASFVDTIKLKYMNSNTMVLLDAEEQEDALTLRATYASVLSSACSLAAAILSDNIADASCTSASDASTFINFSVRTV